MYLNPSSLKSIQSIPKILRPLLTNIDLKKTMPLLISFTPPWKKSLPQINLSLCRYNKHKTPKELLKQTYLDLINTCYFNKVLFTDASKNHSNVNSSVTTTSTTNKTYLLPSICSVFTGKLYGIS